MDKLEDIQLVHLKDIEGFQHADDEYWYRPLIFSDRLFMYVAHIPPGGEMPAHEDAHEFDTCLYMLRGKLEVIYGQSHFVIEPNMALHIPGGIPFGVKNADNITASYVLTFHPPPDIRTVETLKARYAESGGNVKSAKEVNLMVGNTLD